jgi:hypothetical protein
MLLPPRASIGASNTGATMQVSLFNSSSVSHSSSVSNSFQSHRKVLIVAVFLAVVVNSVIFGQGVNPFKHGIRTCFIAAVRKEYESNQYVVIPQHSHLNTARSQMLKSSRCEFVLLIACFAHPSIQHCLSLNCCSLGQHHSN